MNQNDVKMNLWNIKNLAIPPINTYKAENTNIDIKHLAKVFREGKQYFDKDHYMSAEYKVMSIIVYRTKQKFRSAKDFKAFDKIYKALGNYFRINISKDLKRFMNIIPAKYKDETYLPNKSVLDYILVRLQGMVKLLERIVETCKIAAHLFERRLHTGHFWKIGFIIFSLVSRIYILAKYHTKFICEFYNKVVPFSRQLKNSGRNWLPENYVLPTDLQKWMNVNWLDIDDEIEVIETSEYPNIAQFFDLVDDNDDVQFCNEYIMIEDDDDMELANEFKKLENVKKSIQKMRGFDMDEDIGEVIEVDDSLLFDENDSVERDNINNSINLSETNVEEDNTADFGESIEVNNSDFHKNMFTQTSGKDELSEAIILDNSLSDSENCNKINDIIELDNSSEIIDKNVNTPNYCSEVISISDNSLFEMLPSHTSSVNLDNEVITVPDTYVINKRNNEHKQTFEKRKRNLKNHYKTVSEKSPLLQTDFVGLGSEAVTIQESSIINKGNKNKKTNKEKNVKNVLTTVFGNSPLLHKESVSLGSKSVTLPTLSSKATRNKEKKNRFKKKIQKNSVAQKSLLVQTDFVSLNKTATLSKLSGDNKRNNKKENSVNTKSLKNDYVTLPKSSAPNKRNNSNGKAFKKESVRNGHVIVSQKSELEQTSFVSLSNDLTLKKSSAVLRTDVSLDKEAAKSPKTKSNTNWLLKEYSNNITASVNTKLSKKSKRTLAESNDETVINISDSVSLRENENNNTRINFKAKKGKNIKNLSLSENGFDINKSKYRTLTENETNKKRKLEDAENSCKKVKKINSFIEESSDTKINHSKHILVRNGQFNVSNLETNSPQKIKEEPILIIDDVETLIGGVESNKKKFKKVLNGAQKTNNLEQVSNKIHRKNLKKNKLLHRKNKQKKYRYFMKYTR